jgi:menaquinol-cytochrome c reductase cytochrome b/c subunit
VTEIPEHLLKRAAAARDKAAETPAASEPAAAEPAASAPSDSRIPEHLLQRSQAAKAARAGGGAGGGDEAPGGGAVAVADKVGAVVAAPPAAAGIPVGAGPGGHTQRLLTVVKSGSIQDVKAIPVDKVHTWPHLLAAEFVAALACTAFVFIFSVFVNAPLLQLANTNQTPNPSKAPWYFLGLQELLTTFHPMIAGVTLPGVGLIALILAPFLDRNPSIKPEDRKFMISLMTVHMMFWSVLVIIGSFFRGPGFNFVLPWVEGLFFEL